MRFGIAQLPSGGLLSIISVETRDLDENTLLDLDEDGQLCSMTIEHAKERVVGIPEIDYQQIAA